jgi:hypothetical protein
MCNIGVTSRGNTDYSGRFANIHNGDEHNASGSRYFELRPLLRTNRSSHSTAMNASIQSRNSMPSLSMSAVSKALPA